MYNPNEEELKIQEFWKQNNIFEKSIAERPENKPYVFYDGPPFATGLPHYGHIMAGTKKDAVPRYFTMRGYRVERRWGWDCHGLPIENMIEKELKISGPRAIREYGIERFNEACRAKVLEYADEWKKIVPRLGRWVDMDNPYKTMDPSFMESVWWVFSELYKKGLVYDGYKPMHICPSCVTPLSNFEVTQGYKDVTDISVVVKFRIKNDELRMKNVLGDVPTDMLAWTTTPWTLPGNTLLAVSPRVEYSIVKTTAGQFILAASRLHEVISPDDILSRRDVPASELVGLAYEPLFPYFAGTEHAFRVVAADFVTTDDGTGVVHIAPAFGEDDFRVGEAEGVPLVQHVTMEGKFTDRVTDFAGLDVKPKDNPSKADIEIIKWLAHHDQLFSKKKFTHSYPHCWRCDSPLLNYATSSWFVKVTAIQQALIDNNEKITWDPEHMKHGRFGKWLEGVKDWSISRNRFWGTPLPVWVCNSANEELRMKNEECGETVVVGSIAELEKLSGVAVTDLHKHIIDPITFPCAKCGGVMQRVPEVFDTWFDSGAVPYGQDHYPFENKARFEARFPADYIAESQDQTRGWFYTLHVLATALTLPPTASIPTEGSTSAFKTVSVNGIILAEDGQKMSKRLKNYPDPMMVVEKYGADALRYYLLTSPVMHGESLNFSEAGVREMYNKVVNMLWNVVTFYGLYAEQGTRNKEQKTSESINVLDQWIMAKLQQLVSDVTTNMDAYQIAEASRPIMVFVDELSTWYVRRSRDRFKGTDEADKRAALTTLREVLLTLAKVMAPFTPFLAERVWQELRISNEESRTSESVHLELWPEVNKKLLNEKVLQEMEQVRRIVEMGLALRAEAGVKVRQVLGELQMTNLPDRQAGVELRNEYAQILQDELNVKRVTVGAATGGSWSVKEDAGITVALNTEITDELKREGLVREIVRTVNQMRKDAGLTIQDRIVLKYRSSDEMLASVFTEFADDIRSQVLADRLEDGGEVVVAIDGRQVHLSIEKV